LLKKILIIYSLYEKKEYLCGLRVFYK